MVRESLGQILVNTILSGNFVLAMFLGMCPFLGVTHSVSVAFPLGLATTFVIAIASLSAYLLNMLLGPLHLEFLRLICYIVVIAAAVQLVEMFVKKQSPSLFRALGIYLPLITTNCAVLGVALFQTARDYDFLQSITFALGGGAGFTLALTLLASVRERVNLSNVPGVLTGTAMTLMLAGVLSLAFMGFAGIGG
ncbi:MAG TPA: Rnf-Nqr domain containing protein [Rhodocyclaceae bacterium]|nr:Rnf-Nqr domain containing protein [Rhodocyclaceae bacterium]